MLWKISEASRGSYFVPWNQLRRQTHILLTQCYLAHRGVSKHNHCSDDQWSRAHKSHGWSGSSNLRHNENTLQEKHPL